MYSWKSSTLVFTSLTALLTMFFASFTLAQFPSTDIVLVPLPENPAEMTTVVADTLYYLSDNDRYDNQPYFNSAGDTLFFVVEEDDETTNIYRMDVATKSVSQVTDTPASEFSPKPSPDGTRITAIQIEEDGSTQRLWDYDADGIQLKPNPDNVYRTGYYTHVGEDTIVFVTVSDSEDGLPLQLQAVDVTTGAAELLVDNVGVGVQRVPNTDASVSFIQRLEDGSSAIVQYDLDTNTATQIAKALPNVDAHAWLEDGTLIAAKDAVIYRWDNPLWLPYMDFSETEIADINRLAVSPKGDWLAFVINR